MPARTKPLRADAARNRDRLLAAADQLFAERGLDAPLDEIARRAGVSIGTLYNHFATREAFFDALFPERLAAFDELAATALADPDAWNGFAGFVEGMFAMQAQDRGLNDALAQRFPLATEVNEVCHRGFQHVERVIERAKDSGQLRPDFEPPDMVTLIWAMSQVIRESMETSPHAWRRCLGFFLDGLRADAAHPIPVSALTRQELAAAGAEPGAVRAPARRRPRS